MTKPFYIGLMSGTSLDGIDAVLVDFSSPSFRVVATHTESMPPEIKEKILALCKPGENGINRMGQMDVMLGKLFAQAVLNLINTANVDRKKIRAIGSHGQTIRHMPGDDWRFTLQIGDPNIIAAQTGITTIADFRRRDMALGGQAAPLAPAFHQYCLQHPKENRCVINIGGMANLTLLPADTSQPVLGFDTGPGNTLMDAWIEQHLQKPYDSAGEWAKHGNVDPSLLETLLNDAYFHRPPPKSTGREEFNLDWLRKHIATQTAQDIQATLLALTAQSIADAIQQLNTEINSLWLCGGGAKNIYLVEQLRQRCAPIRVTTTQEVGLHPDWVEAVCFAWLAKQTLEKKPGNLPSVTGASKPAILGAIYCA